VSRRTVSGVTTTEVTFAYLSISEMYWNFELSVLPIALTLAMITTEMPAAISDPKQTLR
jgi:hypothetical protein